MKIAVDIMGSDLGPAEIIAGAIKWSNDQKKNIILVGSSDIITEELSHLDYNNTLVEVAAATEVIEMDESPVSAIRKKKDSSLVIATAMVKEKKADAMLSCGNTGAQMAAALFVLGRLPGVERPPLPIPLPNLKGKITLMLDGGANVDCSPKQLLCFAQLGSVYSQQVLGNLKPQIAILNNGSEANKGNNLSINTYQLLAEQKNLNFTGFIEGREVLMGKSDVIVCDGFVGNIVLKSLEGMALLIAKAIMESGGKIPDLISNLDYRKIGGVPLLGVEGITIVCHGSSNKEAVYSGLQAACNCVENDIIFKQKQSLES